MKYKIGDYVRIKTWKELEEEFGLTNDKYISCNGGYCFTRDMERDINNLDSNRIVEIKKIGGDRPHQEDFYYKIKGLYYNFTDDMIKDKEL